MAGDFSWIQEWTWPDGFPPPQQVVLAEGSLKDQHFALVAHADAHFEVIVRDADGGVVTRRHFERVRGDPGQRTVVIVVHSEAQQRLDLMVNGQFLSLLSESAGSVASIEHLDPVSAHRSERPGQEEAADACAAAIARRREGFQSRKAFVDRNHARRPKAFEEQVEDLQGSITRLRDLSAAIRAGADHHVPPAAAEIRALVHWPNEKATWNPLLLRIADALSSPLAVFALPAQTIPGDPRLAMYLAGPSLVRLDAAAEIVDLQEYLEQPFALFRDGTGERCLTVVEALALVANTEGPAHYDDTVVLDIETVRDHTALQTPVLHYLLLQVADALVGLGEELISDATDT